jgi:type VI secretion system (T6SS) effector TldE1-like protein
MTPVEGSDISGRSGLLAHSFMLGPNGDSNGCISIRDYDRFLKAFNDGEINRVIVVPSLSSIKLASRSPTPS